MIVCVCALSSDRPISLRECNSLSSLYYNTNKTNKCTGVCIPHLLTA